MRLRPAGIVIEGVLELGREVELGPDGTILGLGPQTGIPDPYVLSPAFVNAHSHLEYRGLQWMSVTKPVAPDAQSQELLEGPIDGYFPWIRALTRIKATQDLADVARDTHAAARENRQTGVALIGEHSDRPFSGAALHAVGIGGRIFQEFIALGKEGGGLSHREVVSALAREQSIEFGGPVTVSPHAPWSVDEAHLREFGIGPDPFSIHVGETLFEESLFLLGDGPLRPLVYRSWPDWLPPRQFLIDYLASLGLMRAGAQWVHGCALQPADAPRLAEAGVAMAHCPRSNLRLQCPAAPVREWLEAGVVVGLGMDSPASAGPINQFAEMRAALDVAAGRGRPLAGEEVWRMATSLGAQSLGHADWSIAEGHRVPLIAIDLDGANHIDAVIERGSPADVRWIDARA